MAIPFKLKKKKKFDFGNSPVRQDRKQVRLSREEKEKGTEITGGSKTEVINDLEDRIEFLNSDLQETDSTMKRGKIMTQLTKLKQRLKQERRK